MSVVYDRVTVRYMEAVPVGAARGQLVGHDRGDGDMPDVDITVTINVPHGSKYGKEKGQTSLFPNVPRAGAEPRTEDEQDAAFARLVLTLTETAAQRGCVGSHEDRRDAFERELLPAISRARGMAPYYREQAARRKREGQ